MILDLKDYKPVKAKVLDVTSSNVPPLKVSPQPQKPVANSSNQVVKRVLHTRVEMTIYPNGQSYIQKNQAWFEDKIYAVKKKIKKKAAPSKKVKMKKEEKW